MIQACSWCFAPMVMYEEEQLSQFVFCCQECFEKFHAVAEDEDNEDDL